MLRRALNETLFYQTMKSEISFEGHRPKSDAKAQNTQRLSQMAEITKETLSYEQF